MSDIFLSYKSEDRAKAQIIAEALKEKGYSVWWDRIIPIGKEFDEYILEKLDDAKCVLVLWSSKSIKSKWVKDEAREGNDKEILFPVLIEDVKPPLGFRGMQAAKLIDWDGKSDNSEFSMLLDSVAGILEQHPSAEIENHEPDEVKSIEKDQKRSQLGKAEKDITNSIGMKLTLIPAGEFMMGSEEEIDAKPIHRVIISKPFYLGIYPVTQREWKEVMKNHHSSLNGDNLPVEQVSWYDVQNFVKKLNEKEGTKKYRLPSEAEWEYAGQADTTTLYSFGDDEKKLATALLISKPGRYSNEVYSYNDVKSRKKPVKSKYSVIRYPDVMSGINDPQSATRLAIDKLGGLKEFVKPGDKVLVKINVCGGVPDLVGTYTTKEVAGVVVDMVREAGGDPFLCDADMVWLKFWPNAKAEGWVEWAEQKKVKLVNLSETNIVNFDFGKDKIMPMEKVSKEILDANVIISIPAMKTHMMTSVSLGMKNMLGTLPEKDKAKYHKIDIDEVIFTINSAFTPNLTIIDGSIGGETGGPLSCDSVDYFTIIASNDVVTADSIAAQMMGYKEPEKDIEHIKLAHQSGLGDAQQKFDFRTLPYPNISDGMWKRPEPWYNSNSEGKTHEVGKQPSNLWGPYDMHGNVWEWVQDMWHENYNQAPLDGSSWESGDGYNRVVRGGSYELDARFCNSAFRHSLDPGDRKNGVGFRLLMDL